METWMLAAIAGLVWFIVIYKFKAMWRDGWWRSGSVTFRFWAFSLFTAIGLTFMIWPVYLAFDRLVGLPNLGWLVLYVSFSLAIYYLAGGCYLVLKQSQPRLMRWSLGFTLAILCVVYVFGITSLPEKPDHTIPETLSEAIFMETLYVYMSILSAIPLVTFTRLFRGERIVSARLRWLVGLAATLAAVTVMVMKIVLTILAYQDPVTPAMDILYPLISAGVLAVGILTPVAFLPNRLYITLARPLEFIGKVRALRDLKQLKERLDHLCPPVIDDTVDLRAALDNLDFHLYRIIIAILDAKRTLAGYARITGSLTVPPTAVADQCGKKPLDWDDQDLAQARLLHQALQTVDDRVEFTALVQAYHQVGRAARRQLAAVPVEAAR